LQLWIVIASRKHRCEWSEENVTTFKVDRTPLTTAAKTYAVPRKASVVLCRDTEVWTSRRRTCDLSTKIGQHRTCTHIQRTPKMVWSINLTVSRRSKENTGFGIF